MNIVTSRIVLFIFLFVTSGLYQASATTTFDQPVLNVIDTNPDPAIFEAQLSADEQDVNIDGTTVHAYIYKDLNTPGAYAGVPAGIPVPQIVVNVGDEVIVTLTNNIAANCAAIACDTSIHWHGVEVDNDSDGSGVTQNHLSVGQSYTYRFKAPRPGVFWFHPHMKPGAQVFAGMYGAFIVKDPNESRLQGNGTIPAADNTHTLVLGDTEFDANGNVGYVDAGVAIPWATLRADCGNGDRDACREFVDGSTVLVNGQKPGVSTPMITAKSGAGVRLRLINVATNRYFRLSVSNNGADNRLYRIGGEGSFLETVRLEGGVLGSWDTLYDKGEILLSTSQRADVVIVPTGNNGDIITVSGLGYARGGQAGSNNNPAGDLLYIKIDNGLADVTFSIAEGDDVLGAGGVEDLKGLDITDSYIAPVATGNPGDGRGITSQAIKLNAVGTGKTAINSIVGEFEDSGPDYTQVPYQDASRYAKTGDTLEIIIINETNQHHPFHHHGFSFQPTRVVQNSDDSTLHIFDHNEFVDVIDVFSGQGVVVRMRLEDRPRLTDTRQEAGAPAPDQFFASGGAAGRWVLHCHMFHHAALGMITELVVFDTDRDGDGFDTSTDCDDFDVNVNPDAIEICDDGIDNNCNGTVDSGCNRPPVAVDDTSAVVADTTDNPLDVLANDTDPQNDVMTISSVGPTDNGGTVTINSSMDGLLYSPQPGFIGQEIFEYTAADLAGLIDTAMVTITVNAVPVPAPPINNSPTIDGTPATTVLQGNAYSFIPVAGDADGNTLLFSITKKPGWANFSTTTGELSGTPTDADVDTTTGIVITVDDQQGQPNSTASLPAFDLAVTNTTVTNTNDAAQELSSNSNSSGGCVINARSENDPTFPLLILVSLFYLARKTLIPGIRRCR